MTPEVKPIVAGNWKMNGLQAATAELDAMAEGYGPDAKARHDLLICPPATILNLAVKNVAGSGIMIGGQDCHANHNGAHTGDISAEMIADAGAEAVIVGHSERRTDHKETSQMVRSKAEAGLKAGLLTIVCIGETEEERKSGKTLDVLKDQLDNSLPDGSTAQSVVVAYEPVWAIGTGLVPSTEDVAEAHAFIRENVTARFGEQGSKMRLLYGGSVKPGNAVELMGVLNVDGALVGGASLKAADFLGICSAYEKLG